MCSLNFALIGLDYPQGGVIESADRLGFGWIELYLDVNVTESNLERVERELAERKIKVISVSCLGKLNQPDGYVGEQMQDVQRATMIADQLGAPYVTFMYGSNTVDDPETAMQNFVARVEPLGEMASSRGITLLIENVFSRGSSGDLDSADRTAALFDRLDEERFGLNFDPANFAVAGEEAYPYAFDRLYPFIKYMHFKDVVRYSRYLHSTFGNRRPLTDHLRGRHVSVPLGRGIVDYEGLLRAITARGFSKPVALEPFATGRERDRWLQTSIGYLQSRSVIDCPGSGR